MDNDAAHATIVSYQDFIDDPETVVMHVVRSGVPTLVTRWGLFLFRIDPIADDQKWNLDEEGKVQR